MNLYIYSVFVQFMNKIWYKLFFSNILIIPKYERLKNMYMKQIYRLL